MNVLRREPGFGFRGFADCLGEVAALGSTAVNDAGFVEVKVSFDEAAGDQPALEVDRLAFGFEARSDSRDPPVRDPDVAKLSIVESRVFQDEIHVHPSLSCLGGIVRLVLRGSHAFVTSTATRRAVRPEIALT